MAVNSVNLSDTGRIIEHVQIIHAESVDNLDTLVRPLAEAFEKHLKLLGKADFSTKSAYKCDDLLPLLKKSTDEKTAKAVFISNDFLKLFSSKKKKAFKLEEIINSSQDTKIAILWGDPLDKSLMTAVFSPNFLQQHSEKVKGTNLGSYIRTYDMGALVENALKAWGGPTARLPSEHFYSTNPPPPPPEPKSFLVGNVVLIHAAENIEEFIHPLAAKIQKTFLLENSVSYKTFYREKDVTSGSILTTLMKQMDALCQIANDDLQTIGVLICSQKLLDLLSTYRGVIEFDTEQRRNKWTKDHRFTLALYKTKLQSIKGTSMVLDTMAGDGCFEIAEPVDFDEIAETIKEAVTATHIREHLKRRSPVEDEDDTHIASNDSLSLEICPPPTSRQKDAFVRSNGESIDPTILQNNSTISNFEQKHAQCMFNNLCDSSQNSSIRHRPLSDSLHASRGNGFSNLRGISHNTTSQNVSHDATSKMEADVWQMQQPRSSQLNNKGHVAANGALPPPYTAGPATRHPQQSFSQQRSSSGARIGAPGHSSYVLPPDPTKHPRSNLALNDSIQDQFKTEDKLAMYDAQPNQDVNHSGAVSGSMSLHNGPFGGTQNGHVGGIVRSQSASEQSVFQQIPRFSSVPNDLGACASSNYLRDLDQKVRYTITMKLNPKRQTSMYWRHFAGKFGVDIDRINNWEGNHNPTEELFGYLFEKSPEITVQEFGNVANYLDRNDVVSILKEAGY